MTDFDRKHISDPVYKTIGLSKLETEVIDTPVFQRLRRVKHLGLVSLVYPGADFSRFDHSLGVCHITGQILSAIKKANSSLKISGDEIQKYRLAGLLHDIGHYPFSHPMEEAIKGYYRQSFVAPVGSKEESNNNDKQTEIKFLRHEEVGREILLSDPDLKGIFKNSGYDPEEISRIITGSNFPQDSEIPRFRTLVASDLDADRIDYLLRTAHHTGVPYGSIDVDYLISQMVFDESEKRISLYQRALRSAEHLLLCRYFVYQQNIFHKTVAGFEYLLRDISKALLQKDLINFSREDVEKAIKNRRWFNLDDVYIESKIRKLSNEADIENSLIQKIDSIRTRKPVSLVYEWEVLADRGESGEFTLRKQLAEVHKKEAIKRYAIDESLWHLWDNKVSITNLASRMKITEKRDDDEILQSVHLYDPDEKMSRVIMENKSSLMNVMSNQFLYIIRVYVLLPDDKMYLKLEIKKYFEQKLRNP